MKTWESDDKTIGKEIVEKFCNGQGKVITFTFKDELEFEKIEKRIKIALVTKNNEKFLIEKVFLRDSIDSKKYVYNFVIVESKNEMNQLGIGFLEDRVVKIDNGIGKMKIMKEPRRDIYLINQKILV